MAYTYMTCAYVTRFNAHAPAQIGSLPKRPGATSPTLTMIEQSHR